MSTDLVTIHQKEELLRKLATERTAISKLPISYAALGRMRRLMRRYRDAGFLTNASCMKQRVANMSEALEAVEVVS